MKQLLIVRIPNSMQPAMADDAKVFITGILKDSYDVVAIPDNVKNMEFEIVYNPHYKISANETIVQETSAITYETKGCP